MSFSKEMKIILVSNIRGASHKIKKLTSPNEFKDIFQLMNSINIPNGDIIEDALTRKGILSHKDLIEKKRTVLVGILIHNITLDYIQLILKHSCIYFNEKCTCIISSNNRKDCPGIHKCQDFIDKFKINYKDINLSK